MHCRLIVDTDGVSNTCDSLDSAKLTGCHSALCGPLHASPLMATGPRPCRLPPLWASCAGTAQGITRVSIGRHDMRYQQIMSELAANVGVPYCSSCQLVVMVRVGCRSKCKRLLVRIRRQAGRQMTGRLTHHGAADDEVKLGIGCA